MRDVLTSIIRNVYFSVRIVSNKNLAINNPGLDSPTYYYIIKRVIRKSRILPQQRSDRIPPNRSNVQFASDFNGNCARIAVLRNASNAA